MPAGRADSDRIGACSHTRPITVLSVRPTSGPIDRTRKGGQSCTALLPRKTDLCGAVPSELDKVVAFLRSGGLVIDDTDQASRTVKATGTAAQMNALFGVTLNQYDAFLPQDPADLSGARSRQTYRSHEGQVHAPAELADIIVGVFGLDNKIITGRNGSGDPSNTKTTTVPLIMQRYNFPTNSAAGQTVAIFSATGANGTGYAQSDIDAYYSADALRGFKLPTIVLVEAAWPAA